MAEPTVAVPAPDFTRTSGRALSRYYRGEFSASLANNLAYRGAVAIWVLTTVIQPLVSIVVWQTVAGPGGQVNGYTASEFVTYFAVTMLVEHLTFIWLMWEFEYRIRTGSMSPLLLRPIHPVHKDVCDNLSYKAVGLVGVVPAMVLLVIGFGGEVSAIRVWQVLAFLPALLLAMALRFVLEWALALSAFWLTKTSALNNLYFSLFLFLGGAFAPLAVLPETVRTVALASPFPWMLAFPVEVAMGRRTGIDVLVGYAVQLGWLALALVLMRVVWARAVRTYSAVGA
ncbi:ABC transporter permease [Auraticoccus monumenti]|uniref:ABC-2 type transport system permease protein n=1 Tax=Auraticoccus monumenti TaxID=675864 RepID=A0A1G6UCW1_9ACTN|nr:ABC-2 family transporter protein [Auraticoccus monumenti]SDD39089.1 ABC-2 type transport system permease protein [Auraticoccus monumenti]